MSQARFTQNINNPLLKVVNADSNLYEFPTSTNRHLDTQLHGDDSGTTRKVAVNSSGHLKVDIEDATISGTGLATEPKQDDMISLLQGQTPSLNRTKAIPVQIMVGDAGSNYDALRANGQDLLVMVDDMNPDVAVNSGLARSLYQTDGSQKAQAMGTDGASQYQVKTDTDGHLQVDVLTVPTTTVTGTITETNSAAILSDTDSLDSKIIACNTGAVVVSSSVLPTGAATESTLNTLNGKVTACNTGAVVVSSSALPSGAATETTLSTLNGKVTACNTGAVVVSSSALPSGAATESTLSTLNGKVTACNTGAVVVSSGSITETNSAAILADTASLDTKITSGSDSTLSSAVQVLAYGNNSGTLRPVKIGANGELTTEVDHTWTTSTIISLQAVADGASVTSSTFDLGNGISHELTPIKFFVTNSAGVNVAVTLEMSPDNSNWYDDAAGAEIAVNSSAFTFTQEDGGAGDGHRYIRCIVQNNDGGATSTNVQVIVGYYA